MAKKVLVITGSPRAGGNSDMLAEAFIRGAEAAGHNVSRIDAGREHVEGCKACNQCFSDKGACVFDVEFNALAPLIQEADTVVISTPMYWFTFPAQLKAVMDKFYSFLIGKKPFMGEKECVLITCATAADEREFDGIVKTYEIIAEYLKWRDRGYLVVPGVKAKGDVAKTDALAKAEALGRAI